MNDPLVALFAAALEGLLARGLQVTPHADGWLIKLADEGSDTRDLSDADETRYRRSW